MKILTVEELNTLYSDAETADRAHFAESRTNILMYQGDFYKAAAKKILERSKESLTEESKLKLSENHIQVNCNRIKASIINQTPGVMCAPHNENELQDQKDAQLSESVKLDGEKATNFEDLQEKLIDSFVITGEAVTFQYYNPYGGEQKGWAQKTSESGAPLFTHQVLGDIENPTDVDGSPLQPAKSDKPVYEGKIEIEVVPNYNLKRHKAALTMEKSPFLVIDKFVTEDEAKKLVTGHPEEKDLLEKIKANSDNTYKVFEPSQGEYVDSQGHNHIKYWFFRPTSECAEGYYYVQMNKEDIITHGPIPFGIWPIRYVGYRDTIGSPRAKSPIRDARPAQVQLNFLVSRQAYHMVAMSDDKIITQMGSKVQKGNTWNGIREFQVNGPAPVVMPGRDGGQFEAAINRQIATIYKMFDEAYITEETPVQDPWAMLYTRLSNRLKKAPYAKKIERFMGQIWETYIDMAKCYFDDDRIIKAVGKREAINIAEFKQTKKDGYRIKLKPVNGLLEEQMGITLQIQQILQYVGKDLPKNVVARIISQMPFLNKEQTVGDLLITDQNIDSDILALDRGEFRPAMKDDDHSAYMQRLKSRMKQSDFRILPPNIQQMFQARYQQHMDFAAEIAAELRAAEAGYIPMDGGLSKVDVYDEQTGKRMIFPTAALFWLKKQMDTQGANQQQLAQVDQTTQAQILTKAQQLAASQNQQQGYPSTSMVQMGNGMPQTG